MDEKSHKRQRYEAMYELADIYGTPPDTLAFMNAIFKYYPYFSDSYNRKSSEYYHRFSLLVQSEAIKLLNGICELNPFSHVEPTNIQFDADPQVKAIQKLAVERLKNIYAIYKPEMKQIHSASSKARTERKESENRVDAYYRGQARLQKSEREQAEKKEWKEQNPHLARQMEQQQSLLEEQNNLLAQGNRLLEEQNLLIDGMQVYVLYENP